jgi:hypothetical protein
MSATITCKITNCDRLTADGFITTAQVTTLQSQVAALKA